MSLQQIAGRQFLATPCLKSGSNEDLSNSNKAVSYDPMLCIKMLNSTMWLNSEIAHWCDLLIYPCLSPMGTFRDRT